MSQTQPSVRKFLLFVFIIAFPLSFIWEMVQMPLYGTFAQSTLQVWLICGLASVADALYITVVYWLGNRLAQNPSWIAHLNWKSILAIAISAIISATFVERIALSFGLWRYSEATFPTPLLDVGIVPIVQLIVLPLVTFWLVVQMTKHQNSSNS
jgi:hypothetical protein